MSMHTQLMRHLVRLALTAGIAASVLFVGGIFTAPPASASGVGPGWGYQWVAGGYRNYAGLGVEAALITYAPAVTANGAQLYPNNAQSLARIAAVAADGKEAIQVGWVVAPWAYGDSQPHLYVAKKWWTGPVLGTRYCYAGLNYSGTCGWVQVSGSHAPGMALSPGSLHAFQLIYNYYFFSWTVFVDGDFVGYIPATAWSPSFTTMAQAEWYGEVDTQFSPACTQMGNGLYGTQAGAAKMGWLAVQDWSGTWHPAMATSYATNPWLYNVGAFTGASFTYGGPGAC